MRQVVVEQSPGHHQVWQNFIFLWTTNAPELGKSCQGELSNFSLLIPTVALTLISSQGNPAEDHSLQAEQKKSTGDGNVLLVKQNLKDRTAFSLYHAVVDI